MLADCVPSNVLAQLKGLESFIMFQTFLVVCDIHLENEASLEQFFDSNFLKVHQNWIRGLFQVSLHDDFSFLFFEIVLKWLVATVF